MALREGEQRLFFFPRFTGLFMPPAQGMECFPNPGADETGRPNLSGNLFAGHETFFEFPRPLLVRRI